MSHRIDRQAADGTWVPVGGGVSRSEGLGYLWAVRDAGGPRLAARLVRLRDDAVVSEVPALTEVSVGLVAGSPTSAQLRAAAARAIARADALDAQATHAAWVAARRGGADG